MISLLLFLASSLCCVISANLIKSDPVKVVDLLHMYIPPVKLTYLSDILVLIQTVFVSALVDSQTLSEMLLVVSIVQFFRSICSISTALPPLKKYEDKYRIGGLNGTGTEYIFSGHACYSAISTIYLYNRNIIGLFSLIIYNCISQLSIIITRNHYTVDVVLSWIITPLVWGNIHFCIASRECFSRIKFLL